jgi:tRNA U34 5-methylaminomethyl-2-thiouridine-forming methyltransferase MnmC
VGKYLDHRFVVTADGSITLFNNEAGELYHNKAGAYTEALKNYVEPSSAAETLAETGSLNVLDVCFGMGYNSFVLVQQLLEKGLAGQVLIKAIENDPAVVGAAWSRAILDARLALARQALAGETFVGGRQVVLGVVPEAAVDSIPGTAVDAMPDAMSGALLDVRLDVVLGDVREVLPKVNEDFDLVFHDPFSPRKAPELWTLDIFRRYHLLLTARRGRVLTYSIAGAVRGGLLEAGFEIWRTTAVGGKYGGTLATFPDTVPPEGCCPGAAGVGERGGGKRSLVPFRDPTLSLTKDELFFRRSCEQAEASTDAVPSN